MSTGDTSVTCVSGWRPTRCCRPARSGASKPPVTSAALSTFSREAALRAGLHRRRWDDETGARLRARETSPAGGLRRERPLVRLTRPEHHFANPLGEVGLTL